MKTYIPTILLAIITTFGCSSEIEFTPVAPPSATGNSDLLISEISTAINTDANAAGTRPHYVELYNGTNSSIDLSNYAIGYFATMDANTLTDWSFPAGNFLVLTTTLDKGKCYVIAAQSADAAVIKRDITWGTATTASVPLQLSGNSAIALLKKDAAGTIALSGNTYKIIDVFGSPQVARVTSTGSTSTRNNFVWTVAGETDTRNRTFFRKATVTNPTTDWAKAKGTTPQDSEWQLSADRAWVYTNLGLPTQ
jgi:hypothetical protein